MFGLLNLNKPRGVTSRDVVNHVQQLVRPVKVGHTGTLDPIADGVLVVCLGAATRLASYVQRMRKRYLATFLLGRCSDTEDIEGCVTELPDAPYVTEDEVRDVLPAFIGPILQRPPAFSAVKVGGKRAYALARSGHKVELDAREVMVHALRLVSLRYPELVLEIECGGGTYVRSLGRDLALKLGSASVMSSLTRVAVGAFGLDSAVAPRTLTRDNLPRHIINPLRALDGLSLVHLSHEQVLRLRQGQTIELSPQLVEQPRQEFAAVDASGALVAVVQRKSVCTLRPVCNLG